MSLVFWILLATGAAVLMMAASRFAVKNSVAVAEKLRISPFIVGITLVAIGTDTPEMINSIVSSYLGKGDINVGDSIGSVYTQSSLVLGIFPFLVVVPILIVRTEIASIVAVTLLNLLVGIFLMRDGFLGRYDALALILLWASSTGLLVYLRSSEPEPMSGMGSATRHALFHAAVALIAFAIVGVGAAGLIKSITEVSRLLAMPEYILSFFGASIGTSLPELAVEFTALRRNQRQMALGDVFGSCLVDATLSIGVGAILFPISVTTDFALRGSIAAIAAMFIAGGLLVLRKVHDRISGMILILLYMTAYIVFY